MKHSVLIRRFAQATGVTPAVAADQIDLVVARIMGRLRRGQAARVPGLGAFRDGDKNTFHFVKSAHLEKVQP